MKFIPLLWANLWRKKLRTTLSILSIAVAFFLFGMLQGLNAAFKDTAEHSNVDRLIVSSNLSITESLPGAYLAEIERVPGVRHVAPYSWFGSYFREPVNTVTAYPIDIGRDVLVHPERIIPAAQVDALQRDRAGAIIGAALARRFGWKVGDHLTLHSTIWTRMDGSSDWDFNVVGLYEVPTDRSQESQFLFNQSYFDAARSFGRGMVGWYVVQLADANRSAQVGRAIDTLFANSPAETRSQTEKEFQQAFLKQLGDINMIVSYILFAVFFALLCANGSTMMQSFRERIAEVAVMKTIGFGNGTLFCLLLAEAMILCTAAASIGLGLAALAFPALKNSLGTTTLSPTVLLEGLGIAVLLALSTGWFPAWRAQRLSVVEALRV